MYDIKINLTMLLPGRTMMSEQECFITTQEVISKKGKKAKVVKTKVTPDPKKTEKFTMKVCDQDGKNPEVITVHTRKCLPARQILNISKEAYENFISKTPPSNFNAPKIANQLNIDLAVKPKNVSTSNYVWGLLTLNQRLVYNLKELCNSLGGEFSSYFLLDD